MKSIALLLFCAITLQARSQGVFSNETNAALQKVISDYPNRFSNIRGEKLSSGTAQAEYASKVVIPGSTARLISTASTRSGEALGWKAQLFRSPDFAQSRQHYKELFDRIKNTIVRIDGQAPAIISGNYEEPASDRNQSAVSFQLLPGTGVFRQLRVELQLQKEGADWVIRLWVLEKDAENQVVRN